MNSKTLQKIKKKWKKMSTENKVFFVVISFLLLSVLIVGSYMTYDIVTYRSQLTTAQDSYDDKQKAYKNAETEVANLYASEDQVFLRKDLKEADIDKVNKKLEALKYVEGKHIKQVASKYTQYNKNIDKLKKKVEKVKSKFQVQTDVNHLFEKTALNGNEADYEIAIADDLTDEKVSEVKEKHYKENLGKDAKQLWQYMLNKLIEEAEAQREQILVATHTVELVYKDDKLVAGADRAGYEKAKAEIEKIRNKKAKEHWLKEIEKAEQEIKNREEKRRKEKEEREKKEKEAKEQSSREREQERNQTSQEREPTIPSYNGNYKTPEQVVPQDTGNPTNSSNGAASEPASSSSSITESSAVEEPVAEGGS